MNLSIGQRLALAFLVVLVLLVAQLLVSFGGLTIIGRLETQQETTLKQRERSACILKDAILFQTIASHTFKVSPTAENLRLLEEAKQKTQTAILSLEELREQTTENRALLDKIIPVAREYDRHSDELISLAKTTNVSIPGSHPLEMKAVASRNELLRYTAEYHDIQHEKVHEAQHSMHRTILRVKQLHIGFAALMIAVFLTAVLLTTRAVRNPARRLVLATRQLADGVYPAGPDRAEQDLESTPNHTLRDEMAILSRAFSKMTHAISHRDRRLAADIRLSTLLASSLDSRHLSENALKEIADYVNASLGAVYVLDPEQSQLNPLAAVGLQGANRSFAVGEGLVGRACAGRHRVLERMDDLSDPGDEALFSSADQMQPLNLVAVPMLCQDELVGVVMLGAPDTFEKDDFLFLDHAAQQLSTSLQNAMTHDQVTELATDLRQKAEALETADRQKDTFLAMLAHELRNPLAGITSAAYLLSRTETDNETDTESVGSGRHLAVINRQVANMSRLLEDLLKISRLNTGQLVLRKQPTDMQEVVHSAAEAARIQVEGQQLDLDISLNGGPLIADIDPVRMEQVLSNLLHNAFKHTAQGDRVWLTVNRDSDTIQIRVGDSGEGIDPDLLPKIFDLYVQGKRIGGGGRGLGIGLSLVEKLVQMHGGTVWAESEGPHKGSEFVVRIPALDALDDDLVARQPQPGPSFPPSPEPSPQPSPSRRLLQGTGGLQVMVVEDDPDVAQSLSEIISSLGHSVYTVHDGASAIAAAMTSPPDLMLIDIRLPDMDGYEVARQVRGASVGAQGVELVALTGGKFDSRVDDSGFDQHFLKPISLDDLTELLASVAQARAPMDREPGDKV